MKHFLFLSLLMAFSVNSQNCDFSSFAVPELISNDTIKTEFSTIEMLGKQAGSLEVLSVLPSDYNWQKDVRRREAMLRATSGFQLQDTHGRDLVPNVDAQNTWRLRNRNYR